MTPFKIYSGSCMGTALLRLTMYYVKTYQITKAVDWSLHKKKNTSNVNTQKYYWMDLNNQT